VGRYNVRRAELLRRNEIDAMRSRITWLLSGWQAGSFGNSPTARRHLLAITNGRDITIVAASRRVVIGADTHLEINHLAVITDAGQPLADAEFPTCPAGYDAAVKWARSFGSIAIAGVEGTSSYGAGLTWVLQAAGIEVAEVSDHRDFAFQIPANSGACHGRS